MAAESAPAPRFPDIGVHDGIPRAVYEACQAAHFSKLKHFARTAAHAKHEQDFPAPPTDDMNVGDAVHAAILEPARFAAEFACAPSVDRRTTAGKAAWVDFLHVTEGKIVLSPAEFQMCEQMRDSLWNQDTVARGIIGSPGFNERSIVWQDSATGLLCKGRPDRMVQWAHWTVVVDVKTTRNAEEWSFRNDVARYHYDAQAAFYLGGLNALVPLERRFVWIVLEKQPPYLTAVYRPNDIMLDQGARKCQDWLREYRACMETGIWPGYPNEVVPISLPRWATTELEE